MFDNNMSILVFPLLIVSTILLAIIFYLIKRKKKLFHGFMGVSIGIEGKIIPIKTEDFTFEDIFLCVDTKKLKNNFDQKKIVIADSPKGLTLYDNNPRLVLNVNFRKTKRANLSDGDLININGFKFIYINDLETNRKRLEDPVYVSRNSNIQPKFLDNIPFLLSFDNRKKKTLISKNITNIGKSDNNDLVLKITGIDYHHAQIRKISDQCFKLIDLNSISGTYVNGRKFDEKILKNNDEISFDSTKFKFLLPKTTLVKK